MKKLSRYLIILVIIAVLIGASLSLFACQSMSLRESIEETWGVSLPGEERYQARTKGDPHGKNQSYIVYELMTEEDKEFVSDFTNGRNEEIEYKIADFMKVVGKQLNIEKNYMYDFSEKYTYKELNMHDNLKSLWMFYFKKSNRLIVFEQLI